MNEEKKVFGLYDDDKINDLSEKDQEKIIAASSGREDSFDTEFKDFKFGEKDLTGSSKKILKDTLESVSAETVQLSKENKLPKEKQYLDLLTNALNEVQSSLLNRKTQIEETTDLGEQIELEKLQVEDMMKRDALYGDAEEQKYLISNMENLNKDPDAN